jgi:hypothetical protein
MRGFLVVLHARSRQSQYRQHRAPRGAAWSPTMVLLGAMMAIATGFVLGVVHLVDTRPRNASS